MGGPTDCRLLSIITLAALPDLAGRFRQAYTEQCHYDWSYYVEAAPKAGVTVRRG
jgi:hypothetical protein